jgi:oxygen-independent coproporphyrinogen III oxidase
MKIPRSLLEKYNQAVPRYTSYPPANYFNSGIRSEEYEQVLINSNRQQPSAISLYIHIPYCRKICYYCGCNSCRLTAASVVDAYTKSLMKEIMMVKSLLEPQRRVSQLHFGGGTPNALPVEYIEEINRLIFREFEFISDPEIAIECHPAYLTEDYMSRLVKSGFNRFSLGIQDFNLKVLKTANREPASLPVDRIIGFFKGLDRKIKVNLDFIYGLPFQTAESFTETIRKAIAFNPDRIVTFSYAHVPWFKKHQSVLEKAGLPDAEAKVSMFESAYRLLLENGYSDIGMDHYAKGNDELILALQNNELHRNFQGYCTRRTTGQVYAFGVSSISQLYDSYAQNTKDIKEYISKIEKGEFATDKGYHLNFNEIVVREVINHLMCNRHMQWDEIAGRFGISGNELKAIVRFDPSRIESLVADVLLEVNGGGVTITDKGRFFIRNIAIAFDPAMVIATDKKFSKSI